MRLITLTLCTAACVAFSFPASAEVSLADWCTNLNGDISVCNGGPLSTSAAVNTGAFDETLEPSANSLGSIVFTIGTGPQAVAVYMDYDVDDTTEGFDQDQGAAVNPPSATQSYDIDTPANPYFEMNGNPLLPLTDGDTEPTYDPTTLGPPCCDVSWALEESLNVDPLLYTGATVTFTVSTRPPASGFYLQQTDGDTGNSIYLSDTVSLTPIGGTPPVPEPMSLVLFGTLVLGVLFLRRRSAVNAA